MIKFFTAHPTAANLLMAAFLLLGALTMRSIKREGFPDFELPAVTVPEDATQVQPLSVPLLVALEVRSSPNGSRVLLARGSEDPAEIGETGDDPVRRLLDSSQSYKIKVSRSGYRSFEQALTFEPGATMLALAPELERDRDRPPPPPSPSP